MMKRAIDSDNLAGDRVRRALLTLAAGIVRRIEAEPVGNVIARNA